MSKYLFLLITIIHCQLVAASLFEERLDVEWVQKIEETNAMTLNRCLYSKVVPCPFSEEKVLELKRLLRDRDTYLENWSRRTPFFEEYAIQLGDSSYWIYFSLSTLQVQFKNSEKTVTLDLKNQCRAELFENLFTR